MCLTSDAVYRIRDADAIFRIERKDDQKIAQKSKLFYRKYFEFTSNHSGSVRGTLWRIVSKYILFLRMVQSFYRRYLQNTTNNVMGAQEDHDRSRYMRPIRLSSLFCMLFRSRRNRPIIAHRSLLRFLIFSRSKCSKSHNKRGLS